MALRARRGMGCAVVVGGTGTSAGGDGAEGGDEHIHVHR